MQGEKEMKGKVLTPTELEGGTDIRTDGVTQLPDR